MTRDVAATITPIPRFRKDDDGRVRLRIGDIAVLAELTGRSKGHISRTIAGERPGPLADQIADLVGVSIGMIDLPGRRSVA